MRATLFVLVLLATPLVGPATAGHCSHWTTSTGGTTTVVVPAAGYYLVVEANAPPVRFYQESNGLPGLQRGDTTRDDTCHGQIAADTRFV